ncbi:MAG: O-antigen ligase family protein [bacterium]|nr:O-antigen ligase family protein [bacterium]
MPYAPGTYDPLYGAGFLLSLPIALTIFAWLLGGLPGLGQLLRDPIRRVWAVALVGLAVWMWLSVRWSFMSGHGQPNVAQSTAFQFSMVVLWALAAACAGPPPRSVAVVIIISAGLNTLLALLQTAQQGAVGLSVLGEFGYRAEATGAPVLMSGGLRWLRPFGLLPHPNMLAGILTVGFLATPVLMSLMRGKARLIAVGVIVFVLWGLLLTFSRAALLGTAAGAFALLPVLWRWLRRRENTRWVLLAIGACLITGAVFGYSYRDLLIVRTGIGGENTEMRSIADRWVFSLFAYRALTESNQTLFFGLGAGNFPWRSSYYLAETDYDLRGNNVHHIFLSALVETGIVGYGLFVLAVFAGFEAGLRALKPDGLNADFVARACFLAGVVAYGIIGLFDHYPWTMLQFQTLWWGLLAMSAVPLNQPSPPGSSVPSPPPSAFSGVAVSPASSVPSASESGSGVTSPSIKSCTASAISSSVSEGGTTTSRSSSSTGSWNMRSLL